jgi:hypothetical protein
MSPTGEECRVGCSEWILTRSTTVKTTRSRSQGRFSSSRPDRRIRAGRNVIVGAILLGSLSLTGLLLVVLAPSPLVPGAAWSLMAVDSIDQAFLTRSPIRQDQWQTIYIRHTRSRAGNAESIGRETGGLPDHFLIGNGYGCNDGELQVGKRWNEQQPAGGGINPGCIVICLVGDFDQSIPTERQMESLVRLVSALQKRLGIPTQNVIVYDRPGSPAGIGRNFPISSLAKALQG